MSRALPWLVALVQAIALGIQFQGDPVTGFATLPIFTPLSPEMEQAMRNERGQPTPISPREALKRAEAQVRDPDSSVTPTDLRTLSETVEALRAARDRRHGLNVSMMNTAVAVAKELEPNQWAWIHMHRDARDGAHEVDMLDRLRKQLSQSSP
jgi:hypothetical protein